MCLLCNLETSWKNTNGASQCIRIIQAIWSQDPKTVKDIT